MGCTSTSDRFLATGTARKTSDIDFAVKGCKDILKLEEDLEEIETLRKIDIFDYDSIKNKYLLEDIDKYGKQFIDEISSERIILRRCDSMNENESQWDKLLKIKTTGRDDSHADQYRYPYEPTPYSVLERLANSGLIGKGNTLLDYGTGKGRVCFYLSYQTRCHSIGVEYDERIFSGAEENRLHAVSGNRTAFEMKAAETYPVSTEVDRCYFFNPFSVELLQKVLAQIYASYYENPRELLLFFYYPSEEYLSCLMTEEQLLFYDEIDTRDLFGGNNEREKILIFEVI